TPEQWLNVLGAGLLVFVGAELEKSLIRNTRCASAAQRRTQLNEPATQFPPPETAAAAGHDPARTHWTAPWHRRQTSARAICQTPDTTPPPPPVSGPCCRQRPRTGSVECC